MAKKTVYYTDALHDDFAGTDINTRSIPADFPFAITNPFWVILEFIVYRLIATPLVFLIGKIGFGLKIKNRRVIKQLHSTGFYLYGNHTQGMMDSYVPSLAAFPHRTHLIANPDAVSIPGIRRLVMLLGAIPLPDSLNAMRAFVQALRLRVSQKHAIAVYPEAHVWPWYTGIRPFSSASFGYPVSQKVPAVAQVTTYRKRKLFKFLWPCMTVTLSEPFWPDETLSPHAAKQKLRDQVYDFMCKTVSDPENYAHYEYVQKPADAPDPATQPRVTEK